MTLPISEKPFHVFHDEDMRAMHPKDLEVVFVECVQGVASERLVPSTPCSSYQRIGLAWRTTDE